MAPETTDISAISNTCGEHLFGTLHPADSREIVIISHGFASDKDEPLFTEACGAFTQEGVNAFRFNCSGTAPSEGRFEDAAYSKQAGDLNAVITYFSAKGYAITAVMSHSAGATAAILQGSCDRRIRSLLLVAPRVDTTQSTIVKAIAATGRTIAEILDDPSTTYPYPVLMRGPHSERVYHLGRRFLAELRGIDMRAHIRALAVPTAIFRGSEDRKVHAHEVTMACRENRLIDLVPIAGAGHSFRDPNQRRALLAALMQWFRAFRSSGHPT